jgi:hypothetical protein
MTVNAPASHREWREECIRKGLAGECDNNFTFWQMAHYFATGDCLPLLADAEQ